MRDFYYLALQFHYTYVIFTYAAIARFNPAFESGSCDVNLPILHLCFSAGHLRSPSNNYLSP